MTTPLGQEIVPLESEDQGSSTDCISSLLILEPWESLKHAEFVNYFFFLFLKFDWFIFGCVWSLLLCGFPLVAACGLLPAVASLAEHVLRGYVDFSSCGFSASESNSIASVHRLSRSTACGIFPDQGSNLCPLHWQADPLPLRQQESTVNYFPDGNKTALCQL